ncbi:14085_t:CDS:10 [Acaulospora morrowiae]|uniref:Eukaryotic translation initiation factor 5B n=1 Tax=Acaulospora morrowiae TaxID=94023 RepID=A0A9N8V8I5_9GLOM|nr:14085_t:CDS:10 [Acaulospora morrowiae]
MGKKDKKGRKKAVDDWEEDLPTVDDSISKIPAADPDLPQEPTPVVEDDEFGVQSMQPEDWADEERWRDQAEKKKASQPSQPVVQETKEEIKEEVKQPIAPAERRRIEEEEQRKQEAKRLKKEKEKAKKEQLKKEGKLLTKTQKAKQQQAQLRLKQMIEAGVKIEGLEKEGDQKPKRVVYASKKKKPKNETKESISGADVSSQISEGNLDEVSEKGSEEKEVVSGEPINKNIKESWEEDEDDAVAVKNDAVAVENDDSIKDSWDATTDEDETVPQPQDVLAKKKEQIKPSTKDVPVKKQELVGTQPSTSSKAPQSEPPEESEDETEESESESDEEDETESDDEVSEHQKQIMKRKAEAAERRKARLEQALAARSKDNLRSPICCKCFGKGTPIMMYDGRIKPVETIKENDQVMGDDSTPRKVSGVTHGKGFLYRIIPTQDPFAQPFVCNDAHILVLKITSGPSVYHQDSENGNSYFRLLYFVFNHITNLVQKVDKLYSYPSIDYPTALDAERAAFHDMELLDQSKNSIEESQSTYTIIRPGFIWQPSVTQFLDCDPEVRAEARMYAPKEVKFSRCEGAFSRIVDQVVGAPASVPIVKLCAWLIGFWIGGGFEGIGEVSQYINKYISECSAEEVSDNENAYPKNRSNQNVLNGLLQELDILVEKDIPSIMMYDEITLVRLPLLVGLIDSQGFQGGSIINTNKKYGELLRAQRREHLWKFEIDELGVGEYYGFVVDRNHRFLLGDLTVTHNTKLLDKIRQTNVQEGEAGGITQQIGATYFPMEIIKMKTAPLNKDGTQEYKLPGLLIIDTPGHESFTNLRSRGSSLCNIAILVVDIMHGLEPQTLESLRLLRDRKAPFIVALNKIDRLFDWKSIPDNAFQDSLSKQSESVKREFKNRVENTILAFSEQGLNSCLYYENKNFAKNVSLVPTSAITGEGIPDMLMLLVNLTQSRMSNELMYLSELECTVLEVKVIEGHGTTIDVILSNGVLNEGDKIVLCGLNGPIVTTIRALLTPQPMRELRIKSAYVHHKSVKAALGVKISAQDLDKAIAGSRLMVVGPDDDEDDLKDEVMSDLKSLMSSIDKSGRGVCVQASTLGSLEALLEFLKVSKIPVSGINIGPVHKKDIMRAATMLEKAKELAVILCFDVKVDKEGQDLADELGVKIFKADIIYHLFDQFTAYNKEIMEQKRKDQAPQAVFPCILKIIPGAIFNKRDPIIVGVDVVEGVLRTGTPICVMKVDAETKARESISLGKVVSIEQSHKNVEIVKKGQAGAGVAIRLESAVYESQKMYGRHFTESDELYSKISRQSIDVLKESFREDLSKEDWALIIKLKKILDIN